MEKNYLIFVARRSSSSLGVKTPRDAARTALRPTTPFRLTTRLSNSDVATIRFIILGHATVKGCQCIEELKEENNE
jgi:hypothetical protein